MKQIRFFLLIMALHVFTGDTLAQTRPSNNHPPALMPTDAYTAYLPAVIKAPPLLSPPLLIDGEKGWLFASAQSGGQAFTVKLATSDGHTLHEYPYAGNIALDRTHGRLIIDQGDAGLLVLDAFTDTVLTTIPIPETGPAIAHPQVDPGTGFIYAFRNQTIYVVDPVAATIVHSQTLYIPILVCNELGGDASIARSMYDLVNQKLYLIFITYVCTPWVLQTIIAYDAPTLAELGRYGIDLNYQAVPFLDSLYGTTASRLGWRTKWAWNGQHVWFEESEYEVIFLKGIVADWQRQYLYEALGDTIFIIRAYPRELLGSVQLTWLMENNTSLVGHDPITDQLYFLNNGRLIIHRTAALLKIP